MTHFCPPERGAAPPGPRQQQGPSATTPKSPRNTEQAGGSSSSTAAPGGAKLATENVTNRMTVEQGVFLYQNGDVYSGQWAHQGSPRGDGQQGSPRGDGQQGERAGEISQPREFQQQKQVLVQRGFLVFHLRR